MKEEIKNLWVEALRSGNYKQRVGGLKPWNDGFCCLGVLCDISKQGKWKEEQYLNNDEYLPNKVREWAGMNSCSGYIPTMRDCLSLMNDHGMSFEQIADIIEKHWEKL
jgi:hypothetical protein